MRWLLTGSLVALALSAFPGLVEASEANKAAASEYIAALEAEGVTVTDLALEEAFSDLEIDTIYLITDGAPHPHRYGRLRLAGRLAAPYPPDPRASP